MSKRTKNIRNMLLSDFYCTKCSYKGIPIVRTVGQEREPGHLKKIFCLHCQQEVNMVEIRPVGKYTLDDFLIEYDNGNFTPDGNRIEPWGTFVAKIKQKGKNNEE